MVIQDMILRQFPLFLISVATSWLRLPPCWEQCVLAVLSSFLVGTLFRILAIPWGHQGLPVAHRFGCSPFHVSQVITCGCRIHTNNSPSSPRRSPWASHLSPPSAQWLPYSLCRLPFAIFHQPSSTCHLPSGSIYIARGSPGATKGGGPGNEGTCKRGEGVEWEPQMGES